MIKFWKKIVILFSVISIVTYTVIPPKKADASAIGTVTTLGALAASMPTLAPVAIVGVACVLLLGLTITNFDEIVELGQRVADSMTKKGYKIEDYVNDIAYTLLFNAALKQTIQEIAGNVPDHIPYIENRLDDYITIPVNYTKFSPVENVFIGTHGPPIAFFNNGDGMVLAPGEQVAFTLTFTQPITEYENETIDFGDGDIYTYDNMSLAPGVKLDGEPNNMEYQSKLTLNSTALMNSAGNLIGFDVRIRANPLWNFRPVALDGIIMGSHVYTTVNADSAIPLIDYPNTAFAINKSQVISPTNVGELTNALFPTNTTIAINKDITLTGKNIYSIDEISDYQLTEATTTAIAQSGIIASTTGDSTGGTDVSGILGILQAILNAILGLGQSIVDGVVSAFSWLQTLLNNIWSAILSIPGASAIASAIGQTFSWLGGALTGILEAILSLPILIASAVATSFHWLQGLLSNIWEGILSLPGSIGTAIGLTFSWLQGLLTNIWEGISSLPGLIGAAISTAFSWLQGLLTSIWEGIVSLPSFIGTAIGSTFSWLQNLLSNIWDGIVSIPGAIGGVIGNTFSWLQGLLTNIWQTAIAIPGATYDVLVDVFNLVFTLDQDWLQSQLQILVAELALKIPAVPNVVEMIAYKGDKDEWAGLYANFDHYGIGKQKVVDNHAPNFFRHTTKIIIRGFLYFLLALFFIRKVYIFADD